MAERMVLTTELNGTGHKETKRPVRAKAAPRGNPRGVVILEIDVPRRWLRRSKRGLYYCLHDIPPERIRGVVTFGQLAA